MKLNAFVAAIIMAGVMGNTAYAAPATAPAATPAEKVEVTTTTAPAPKAEMGKTMQAAEPAAVKMEKGKQSGDLK